MDIYIYMDIQIYRQIRKDKIDGYIYIYVDIQIDKTRKDRWRDIYGSIDIQIDKKR